VESTEAASYGRHLLGAIVPVNQHDFGCRDVLIGGGPALKKARLDPVGECVVFRKPSRAWVNFKTQEKNKWQSVKRLHLNG
jgi:hypothetical protein